MIAVAIESISKRYGDTVALDNVSLSIPQGGFFGLLGPNGAGKTTLIGILSGLVKADSGTAKIMGSDVETDRLAAKRKIGVVPQELIYDPFFNVRESLEFQSRYHGIFDNRVWIDELLAKLALVDKAKTNTRALSGGMKRRLMIALALVHKPPVIVLDEPTAGVDVELRRSLWGFIRELHGRGHTIVLTTHYLEEAEELCDRVAMMREGEIVVEDDTAQLIKHFHDGIRVRAVLSPAEPPPAGASRCEDGEACFSLADYSDIEPLLARLRADGRRIIEMEVLRPDLEDVFVKAVSSR